MRIFLGVLVLVAACSTASQPTKSADFLLADGGADDPRLDAPSTDASAGAGRCPAGQDAIGEMPALDAELESIVRDGKVPGLSVAIVKNGKPVFARGYGVARPDGTRQTARSIHPIASASKPVTAVAVMQLVEAGRLRLDDDVNTSLGGLSIRSPAFPSVPITVRMLLTHTASIADTVASFDGTYFASGDSPLALADFVGGYFSNGSPYSAGESAFLADRPGTVSCYSNMGVGLLSLIVERVSGVGFGEYCRTRIFEPLGMRDTSFYLRDVCDATRLVFGLKSGPQGVVSDDNGHPQPENHPEVASGMLRTSVVDMGRFVSALVGDGELDGVRILSEASVAELKRRQLSAAIPSCDARTSAADQGLLAYYTKDSVSEYFGHAGGMVGVRTDVFFRTKERDGFVIFANTSDAGWLNDVEIALLDASPAL